MQVDINTADDWAFLCISKIFTDLIPFLSNMTSLQINLGCSVMNKNRDKWKKMVMKCVSFQKSKSTFYSTALLCWKSQFLALFLSILVQLCKLKYTMSK